MINKYKRKYILPLKGTSFYEQLDDCYRQIIEIKDRDNTLLQITFFIKAKNNKEYLERKNIIFDNQQNIFKDQIPATSIVSQIPDNKEVSVEIVYMTADEEKKHVIQYKKINQVIYTLIESDIEREIFGAGITLNDFTNQNKYVQAETAFKIMNDILENESMTFADVIRQWNYVEDIVGYDSLCESRLQNYQILNEVRAKYYAMASFKNGYPAATGIGMNAGGIILEFYACHTHDKEKIIPVKNPKQKDAYEYSQEVLIGSSLNLNKPKSAPKFERAKYIAVKNNRLIFISGTASIQGEKTIGVNDIETQTKTTIENINNLISVENLKTNGILNNYHIIKFSSVRVYVKSPHYISVVRQICNKSFPEVQVNYLIADICRDNLLVEIEGIAELTS
jgi:enamine deaminase RidA (YjgF/YER057c/UK114 family)